MLANNPSFTKRDLFFSFCNQIYFPQLMASRKQQNQQSNIKNINLLQTVSTHKFITLLNNFTVEVQTTFGATYASYYAFYDL